MAAFCSERHALRDLVADHCRVSQVAMQYGLDLTVPSEI